MRQNGGGKLSALKGKTHEAQSQPGFVSQIKDRIYGENRMHHDHGRRMYHKHMAAVGIDTLVGLGSGKVNLTKKAICILERLLRNLGTSCGERPLQPGPPGAPRRQHGELRI